jgi:hypothetical protein
MSSPAVVGRRVLRDAIYGLLIENIYKVHLFVNNFTPTVDTALGAFTEASYDTYPSGGISPAVPTFGDVGNQDAMTTVGVTFPAPTASGPVSIYGFWVEYKSVFTDQGNYMLMGARFPGAPIVLTNGGVSLPIVIDFRDLDLNNP